MLPWQFSFLNVYMYDMFKYCCIWLILKQNRIDQKPIKMTKAHKWLKLNTKKCQKYIVYKNTSEF